MKICPTQKIHVSLGLRPRATWIFWVGQIFMSPSKLGNKCIMFVGVMALLELRILKIHSFSALFSFKLWHIVLKFCIWFCFTVPQIKFECRQFASIFVGVMPLLELKILEIHSFPHFSLTCFDILSWNFAYDFVLLCYRSSSSVVNFCRSYAPFGT